MKNYDYEAVIWNGDVYCVDCLPDEDVDPEEIYPIFADQEWEYAPTCCICGHEHNYVSILSRNEE